MSTTSVSATDSSPGDEGAGLKQAALIGEQRRRRLRRVGAVLAAAIVLTIGAIVASGSGSETARNTSALIPEDQMQRLLAQVPQQGITLGRPSAPVTLTEFADLQCPYCDAYTLGLLPKLVLRFVQPGKVKMVFRNMSFLGPQSLTAGRAAAAAAEQNKLWNFVDAFYYNQGRENTGYVTPAFLRRIASEVPELKVDSLMAARGAPFTLDTMKTVASLAKAEGITATPTFIIGGPGLKSVRVVGMPGLEQAIDKALARQGSSA